MNPNILRPLIFILAFVWSLANSFGQTLFSAPSCQSELVHMSIYRRLILKPDSCQNEVDMLKKTRLYWREVMDRTHKFSNLTIQFFDADNWMLFTAHIFNPKMDIEMIRDFYQGQSGKYLGSPFGFSSGWRDSGFRYKMDDLVRVAIHYHSYQYPRGAGGTSFSLELPFTLNQGFSIVPVFRYHEQTGPDHQYFQPQITWMDWLSELDNTQFGFKGESAGLGFRYKPVGQSKSEGLAPSPKSFVLDAKYVLTKIPNRQLKQMFKLKIEVCF